MAVEKVMRARKMRIYPTSEQQKKINVTLNDCRFAYNIKVDKWFPSSQVCHQCGYKQIMPLSVRTYTCPECGMVCDRDYNAALNIRAEGLRMLGLA